MIGEGKEPLEFCQKTGCDILLTLGVFVALSNRYYHELFIRGRTDLCIRMTRTRVKGNGSKAASSPATEPNFYNMEYCLPGEAASVESSVHVEEATSNHILPEEEEEEVCEDLERAETPEHFIRGFDFHAVMEVDPVTPVSKTTPFWDDNDENDLGIIAASVTEAKFTNLPPVVTPGESTQRKTFSNHPAPRCLPPLLPKVSSFGSIPPYQCPEDIHSGDQVYFEGLPFHYLELKDVEESLIHGEVHFV